MAGSIYESGRQLTAKGKNGNKRAKKSHQQESPKVNTFISPWLFAVRQVLLRMLVRKKEDVVKAVQELGPSLLAAPTEKVSLLYCETTPWCLLHASGWEQESTLSPSSWQWLNKWQACQTSLLHGQWMWWVHRSLEKSICVGFVYSLLAETMAYLIQECSQGACWHF